jgi:hypothetical protein
MSDKFLSTGGSGNADISNGTINAYVAGLTIANLKGSMPIKTNSINTLVSTKLDITDINNLESRLNDVSGITNPYVGDFKATDFETDDYFSVNDELQKIDNFTASTATDTNITGIVKVPEVATDRVYDSTQATFIELNGTSIDVNANDLRLNTSSVITEAGNKNLDTTLTTTQTVFNNDQELITKKVVSDLTGRNSGKNDVSNGIAIGSNAGLFTQGNRAIAIGNSAGQSNQTSEAIAIGIGAGEANQGNRAISIGRNAGGVSQGDNCVAIGYASGYTNQANNSIILNATGDLLNNTVTNSTRIAPIRNIVGGKNMSYNPYSKEVSYNNVGNYVEVSATTNTTIDSTSYNTISGMTITPPAGTYKVEFSCWFENDEKKEDDGLEIALYKVDTIISHSKRRQWTGEAGKYETSIHTQAIITVSGGQQIRARAKRLGGDRIKISQRSMVVVCVGSAI